VSEALRQLDLLIEAGLELDTSLPEPALGVGTKLGLAYLLRRDAVVAWDHEVRKLLNRSFSSRDASLQEVGPVPFKEGLAEYVAKRVAALRRLRREYLPPEPSRLD
jgi:hypothetical protein